MKSYQRSFRLKPALKPQIESLPNGTVNLLVNELLITFFADNELRCNIAAGRFKDWQPSPIREPPTRPLPFKESPMRKSRNVDDIMPGV